eukprot:319788_1
MSDHDTKKIYADLNFDIFGKKGDEQCDQNCNDPLAGCVMVKRLVISLAFYSRLDIQNSKADQDKFIAFINEVYNDILDDYAHLVREHRNLEAITEALKTNALLPICDVTKCIFTSRHYAQLPNTITTIDIDRTVQFYSQIMDSFHFYVQHMFECGLRTERPQPNDNDQKQDDSVGTEFARIARMTNERQHIRSSFSRFKDNTKFNLQTSTHVSVHKEATSPDKAYIDEMFRYLLFSSKGIDEIAIRNVWKFLTAHQYDSDSIKADIKCGLSGNIASGMSVKDIFKEKGSWIYALWSKSSTKLEQKYSKKGFQIAFANEKNHYDYDVDCLVITKV